jgi:hypothetical protein
MLKKFNEGLLFGGGFAISFVTVWYVAAYLITPMFSSFLAREVNMQLSGTGWEGQSTEKRYEEPAKNEPPFHELTLEEKIKSASVIALARYERGADGMMRAIIKEFLKKEPDVTIYYDVGDEYQPSSYYPKENTSYGDGMVIFFVGSPASMRMSMSYSGDRIRSLGDLPLELFRRKCQDPDSL